MNLKDTYNKIAKDWFEDHKGDTWSYKAVEKFSSLMKPGSLVLDAGCGPGLKTAALVKSGLKVVGIDLSEEFIKIAKGHVPEAEFQVMDLMDLSGLSQEFDGIFLLATLLHFPKKDVPKVLANLISKLKPGGLLYIAVKEIWPGTVDEEVKTENDYGYEYDRFFSYFTKDELEGFVSEAGLELVETFIIPFGNTNWLQVIGKKKSLLGSR